MHFGRSTYRTIMCPHLKGSDHGAECTVANDVVRNIENAEIKFCMSRHFEVCHVYVSSLRREKGLMSQLQPR